MRGSRLIGNSFKNIYTSYDGDKGPGGLSAQGVYLDDMVSGYEVAFNTFTNCSVGSFVGGGIPAYIDIPIQMRFAFHMEINVYERNADQTCQAGSGPAAKKDDKGNGCV